MGKEEGKSDVIPGFPFSSVAFHVQKERKKKKEERKKERRNIYPKHWLPHIAIIHLTIYEYPPSELLPTFSPNDGKLPIL